MSHIERPIPGSLLLLEQQAGNEVGNIVLSPTPSNHVNDPLRWSKVRKNIATIALVLYSLTVGVGTTTLYSVLVPIQDATGIPLSTLNAGTGYMFLLLGWGGLITQPFAAAFGKRPTYIISQLGCLAVIIWMPFIKSSGEWLGNKVVQGLVAAPVEMLVEVSLADIFYAHERGLYMGLYVFTIYSSNYLAPSVAGFIYERWDYKAVFWFSAAQQAIGLFITVFFLEESNFNRGATELSDRHGGGDDAPPLSGSPEDQLGTEKDLPVDITTRQAPSLSDELEGVPTSTLRKLRIFNGICVKPSQSFTMAYRPLLLYRFPGITWAGFQYGMCVVWYSVLNATASSILSAPPYNFPASMVGVTYYGPFIGVCIAIAYSGYFGNRFSLWIAKRKGGVREPEDRLWLMGVTTLLTPVGLILWGVGAAAGIHWIGLVIGATMVACSGAIGATLTINYAIDCYKDLGNEAMVTVIILRNTMTFAIGYAITPWLNMGLRNTFITAAMVGLLTNSTFLIVIKYGKAWRAQSKDAYWHYVLTSVVPTNH